MGRQYARRLSEIQPFRVMKLMARANELHALGHPVVHMEVGEPDFPTPSAIMEGARVALDEGRTKYTPAEGIGQLREKLATYYQTQYGLDVPTSRIFITSGGSGALLLATALTLNAGEGLLMTDPGYPCNRHFMKSFGADGHLVPVSAGDGYQLSPELVERYWQETTRGVLLASPANPTGAVMNPLTLAQIIELVEVKKGHVIVDEIYHGLYYADQRLPSALSMSDQVIVVNSFSKYFGMTGWRLGWMVVPENAISLVEKLAQNLFICPSSVAQYAALNAFSVEARMEMEGNREEFRERRDFMLGELRELGFGVPIVPEGAFYIYAKIPTGLEESEKFCARLLEHHNVAITPGTDFGFNKADEHVRFSYAQNLQVLSSGIENLKSGLMR